MLQCSGKLDFQFREGGVLKKGFHDRDDYCLVMRRHLVHFCRRFGDPGKEGLCSHSAQMWAPEKVGGVEITKSGWLRVD